VQVEIISVLAVLVLVAMNHSSVSLSSSASSGGAGDCSPGVLSFPPRGQGSSPPLECNYEALQFTTPKSSATTKRLIELRGGSNRSPALTVPASPLMKRLGYGTG